MHVYSHVIYLLYVYMGRVIESIGILFESVPS